MIAMALTAAKVAGGFLKKIPWQVWAAIGAAILVWRVVDYHHDTVEQAAKDGDAAGYARAMEQVRIKAEQIRRKAEAAKAKADKATATIVQEVRDAREEDVTIIRSRADALIMRGPPATGGANSSAAGLPGTPGATAGQAPGAAVNARLATVPWEPLVGFGERHDICQRDLKAWWTWYDGVKHVFDTWQPPAE